MLLSTELPRSSPARTAVRNFLSKTLCPTALASAWTPIDEL
jgi:hypothetical protein